MSDLNSFKLKQLQFEFNTPSLQSVSIPKTPKSLFLQNLHAQISSHKVELQNPYHNLVMDWEHQSGFASGQNNYLISKHPKPKISRARKFLNILGTESRIKNKDLIPTNRQKSNRKVNSRSWLIFSIVAFLSLATVSSVVGLGYNNNFQSANAISNTISQASSAGQSVENKIEVSITASLSSSSAILNSSHLLDQTQGLAIGPKSALITNLEILNFENETLVVNPALSLEATLSENQISSEDQQTIDKINSYINKFRSNNAFNRDWEAPVAAKIFLQVSKEYEVPLKYMLSLARIESQFGTNRFNSEGNPNRIGRNKNMYSLGLNDRGDDNLKSSWEDGVTAFGKWYQKFEERGVTDCQKWRIFNPNGDNCQRVEAVATETETWLEE